MNLESNLSPQEQEYLKMMAQFPTPETIPAMPESEFRKKLQNNIIIELGFTTPDQMMIDYDQQYAAKFSEYFEQHAEQLMREAKISGWETVVKRVAQDIKILVGQDKQQLN